MTPPPERDARSLRIGAVVPAAGWSRRMGGEKILLPFGRSTVLGTVLETLAASGVLPADVAVVLRPDLDAAAALARRAGCAAVANPDPRGEMMSSIRIGIDALPQGLDAFFVWPADHPAVAEDTLRRLASGADPARVRIPVWDGRRGHPALVGVQLREEARAQTDAGGLRALWRVRADAVDDRPVEDPGVVANVDTPEQYAAARALRKLDRR
jgi:molybdenum cofactor cytidylyltransferase